MGTQKRRLLVLLVIILMLTVIAGCPQLRRAPDLIPAPEPDQDEPLDPRRPAAEPPAIPEEIAEGANQEPQLRVYIAEQNQVTEMAMEEYLMGVVAAEMEPDWDKEALKAQAIIARSFTLQKIAEDGGVPERDAHASTDIEEFQAYDAERINDNVREAVEETRGQVAVHGGEFIRGWFHAYAGPRTALATEGLEFQGPNPPYIHIVDSPADDIIPDEERDWEEIFPLSEVREATQSITGDDPGEVTDVEIAEEGPSGRVTRFRVNDVEVSGPELRLALGSTEMRATFVDDISIEGNQLVMSGTGFGHGVGMCQWGARAMADDGQNAEEIVQYYYRDIEIVDIWQ